jgi:Ca2+-binding RTX toxin-like protein
VIDIDAGPGDDAVDASRAGAGSTTSLGAGADRFLGSSLREYVDVDEGDGGPDRVRTGGGRDRVRVARGVVVNARLGAGHDELELFTHYSDSPLTGPGAVVRAQLGAGDDVLRFNTSYAGPGSEFLMGPGSDGVGFHDDWEVAGAGETSLVADLAEGLVTWHDVTSAVRDAENLSVTARTVDVRGNSSGNHFFSMGCDVTFRGGAGEDWITMRSHTIADQQPFSCEPGDVKTAFGDAGPDHLFGWRTHDELFGGPGRDRAHGGSGGDDVCIAEIVAGKGCGRPS